ncbi:MAG: Gfo/Idh/MocA family oxidoreductase [Candidatus Koribacter versatilis]|uniref:Gfo/Idh/MocA family oxidoreductase n=1 Tax=Candidatus Korobacter versatilis TaxID=658062 RepID=A0A932A849_9BACT|nr:Gfo/Idh/MocA family oxidoreductase [Candidatus Koribacter versatilis]
MQAIASSGSAEVALICDASPEIAGKALATVPGAAPAACFRDLLRAGLDGIVIATPSALHAEQSLAALESGLAVFCQKPLGRTAAEAGAVIAAARRAHRLLAVDFSYRFTAALQTVRGLVRSGALGEVYAANVLFHNAYGPDKQWFYDPALSGGGCVMDLGVHLVDAALWILGFPEVTGVSSRLYAGGALLPPRPAVVEDYATARLDLAGGVSVDLACSWRLPVGQDCVIAIEFYGTKGGAAFRNVGGSFYDFTAEHYDGTRRTALAGPPDAWPGRAPVDWAGRLAAGEGFDPAIEHVVSVAGVLDSIYGR